MVKQVRQRMAIATDEPAAVWVSPDVLVAWKENPRCNDTAVGQVVDSIKRFGFASPIIARAANGEVIAGHTRLRAAKVLKLDLVPVRFLDVDEDEAHMLALADNKLGEIADWDEAQLNAVLSELKLKRVDLQFGTGFLDRAMADLLDNDQGDDDKPKKKGKAIECPSCGHQFRA